MKRSHIIPWLICGLGALFYCYEYVLRIMPSVMAQDLMATFNINAFALGSLAAFYYYSYTAMQLPVGVLMDKYGPRRLLVFAALMCALGSYIFAHGNLFVAHLGRFLVGLGSAFAFVGVLKLATIWLPPSRFAMIAGFITSLGMLGAMSGDRLLGYLVQNHGWTNIVNALVIAGVVIALVFWFAIPHHQKDEPPAIESLEDPKISYNKLFTEVLGLIRKPQMWVVGIIGFLVYMPVSVFAELWGIPYLERAYNLSTPVASNAVSMVFLGFAVGAPLAGFFSDQLRSRRIPIIIGSIGAALCICTILYFQGIASNYLSLLFFLFGAFTSTQVIVFAIAREINFPELAATAMALTNLITTLASVIFQPLLGMFLDMFAGTHATGSLSVYSGKDFQHAMVILPVGLVLAVFFMFFIRETHGIVEERGGHGHAAPLPKETATPTSDNMAAAS